MYRTTNEKTSIDEQFRWKNIYKHVKHVVVYWTFTDKKPKKPNIIQKNISPYYSPMKYEMHECICQLKESNFLKSTIKPAVEETAF
jgi:hypothetical protein